MIMDQTLTPTSEYSTNESDTLRTVRDMIRYNTTQDARYDMIPARPLSLHPEYLPPLSSSLQRSFSICFWMSVRSIMVGFLDSETEALDTTGLDWIGWNWIGLGWIALL